MSLPQGLELPPGKVVQLKKSLYSTKQAGRLYYEKLKAFMLKKMAPCFVLTSTTNACLCHATLMMDSLVPVLWNFTMTFFALSGLNSLCLRNLSSSITWESKLTMIWRMAL
mmetsp:Transcript_37031/g.93019  ORF Transcript_37031/g.93019 Transcript_37031/m.93019 type:complete len:111 (+) Transcript_37031:1744-2076(+)